ncbi:MAG: amidohydrolase family protein [Desulfuromonadales bacterium]|nr:amidohydrolase family protein [Desulfuromonadales bacterium]
MARNVKTATQRGRMVKSRTGKVWALRAITINGPRMIDREKELGSLEPGKLAAIMTMDLLAK